MPRTTRFGQRKGWDRILIKADAKTSGLRGVTPEADVVSQVESYMIFRRRHAANPARPEPSRRQEAGAGREAVWKNDAPVSVIV